MKISIFQGVLLAIFGIAALIGLFVFTTYKSTNPGAAIGPVVIWGTLPKEEVTRVLAVIGQTNEVAKNISYVERDANVLIDQLVSAIAIGSSPDLVLVSQESLLPLVKFIVPLPSTDFAQSNFEKAFVAGSRIFYAPDGSGAYGIPFLVDPLVLFHNRTIFNSAGIAQPPSTWEVLTGLVPRLTTQTQGGSIARGLIALGTYTNVHNARAILSALFLQTGLPVSAYEANGFLKANIGARGSSGISPGQAVVRFYTQFSDPAKVSYTWNASLPDSQTMFLSGDTALYIGFASEARYLRRANPNLDFEVSPLPQPATATYKSTYGLMQAFVIPRGAKNPRGAYLAAQVLTDPTYNKMVSDAVGLAPAVRVVLASPPSDPITAVAYASALYAEGWLSPVPSSVDQVFGAMITNVISGRFTVESALNAAELALSGMLQ
jgi:multiple sugar transport system substrate-binding protein